MRRSPAIALALLALMPVTAPAAEAPRIDPEAGSPAETIYGIPLDEARRDAAPEDRGGAAVRSELGVGSSARVPGRTGGRATGSHDGAAGPKGQRARRAGGSGAGNAPEQRERLGSATEATPSALGTWSLLVLCVLVAAGAGVVAAGRRTRRA